MQSDLLFIRNRAIAFVAFSLLLCAMMGLVYIDVNWMNNAVHETSLTEITQELILLVIGGLWFTHALRRAELRPALVLVGGFFTCMLIRELDFLFDMIVHGSWVWFALTVTALSLIPALRRPRDAIAQLSDILRHPGWGMMCAGLLTVLVYSRLFGMHELWEHMMGPDYNRAVKNIAEEGCELLGYTFCLFASHRFLYGSGKLQARQRR